MSKDFVIESVIIIEPPPDYSYMGMGYKIGEYTYYLGDIEIDRIPVWVHEFTETTLVELVSEYLNDDAFKGFFKVEAINLLILRLEHVIVSLHTDSLWWGEEMNSDGFAKKVGEMFGNKLGGV